MEEYKFYTMVDEMTGLVMGFGVFLTVTEFLNQINARFSKGLEMEGAKSEWEEVSHKGNLYRVNIFESYIDKPRSVFPAYQVQVQEKPFLISEVYVL